MKEGEIVQVQGGHIIRATGRKDRHSKVYTAKGPRDRRVRLSAHTAIQFYDVQDRLGYDRPSKAVDWLMKKAKSAIDKLAELPPFDPAAGVTSTAGNGDVGRPDLGGGDRSEAGRFEIEGFENPGNPVGFTGYPNQDLCLSLQSFQDPGGSHPGSSHGLFPVGFEAGGSHGNWVGPETGGLGDMGQFSRLLAWSGAGFHPQPSIRAWGDLPMGPASGDDHRIPKDEMQQQAADGFAGFYVPAQIHGGGGGGEGNLAYHHHHHHQHHHNSGSSMSTDSSR